LTDDIISYYNQNNVKLYYIFTKNNGITEKNNDTFSLCEYDFISIAK